MIKEYEAPLGVEEIQKIIPHRHPFLMLDRVTEFTKEKDIVALKNMSHSDPIFQGHFPGNPVFPGVLMVEAMAQASAVLGMISRPESRHCFLTEVNDARFRMPVTCGDTLRINVKVMKMRSGFFWFEGEGYVEDKQVVSAGFSARLS